MPMHNLVIELVSQGKFQEHVKSAPIYKCQVGPRTV